MKNYEETVNAFLIELFAEQRKKQGYTLESLANLANIHRTTIGLIERGERNPTIILALQLAKALGIPLSSLLQQAEKRVSTIHEKKVDHIYEELVLPREVQLDRFYNLTKLEEITGLKYENIQQAILACYNTLDVINKQLISKGSLPLTQLVELANLSSMIGNLLSGSLAEKSGGMYTRNKPHTYPDLIPIGRQGVPLELKVALETNNPKGHLIKPGVYLIFRYVLCTADGQYRRKHRGDTVRIWECRVGQLQEDDFSFSSTEGDSGKTAVIKTSALENMCLIYFVSELNPYIRKFPKIN